MSNKKAFMVCGLLILLLIIMTACANNAAAPEGQETEVQQQTEPTTEEETISIPSADPAASVDSLLGSWVDIGSPDRFANITKTETGYHYEDNEGAYPATFKEGILKITVSDTEIADVYFDVKTGHMFSIYQDILTEFSRK